MFILSNCIRFAAFHSPPAGVGFLWILSWFVFFLWLYWPGFATFSIPLDFSRGWALRWGQARPALLLSLSCAFGRSACGGSSARRRVACWASLALLFSVS